MTYADEMNARALAEEIRRLREDLSFLRQSHDAALQRLKLLEGTVGNSSAAIAQLQALFAERTVVRGTGSTVVDDGDNG